MKLVVVGGHSRDIGKTSVTAAIIAATRDLNWTALKITQYGHGICSSSGDDCDCVVDDPDCPYAILPERDAAADSDTSRFLRAGATEAFWVRTRMGQLEPAMPALRRLLAGRDFVMIESNSVLEFLTPDLYFSVLQFDVADFKPSSRKYLERADAFVVVGGEGKQPAWDGVAPELLRRSPSFAVDPPSYFTDSMETFVRQRLGAESA